MIIYPSDSNKMTLSYVIFNVMRRILYIIIPIFCCLFPVVAEAQTTSEGGSTFTLSGRVTDENQDPLELATVTIMPQMKA